MEAVDNGLLSIVSSVHVLTLPNFQDSFPRYGAQHLVSMIFTRLVKVAVLLSKAWVP